MKCFWRFYRCLFTVIVVAHYGTLQGKTKKKIKGGREGIQQKNVEEMREALGCDSACWMDVEKRIRTKRKQGRKKRTVEESHLKLQVDTQTQFMLPAVPNLTKRGQTPALLGALCQARALTPEASRTPFSIPARNSVCHQSLLSPGKVKPHRKSPESCAARNSLHFDSVVTVIFV